MSLQSKTFDMIWRFATFSKSFAHRVPYIPRDYRTKVCTSHALGRDTYKHSVPDSKLRWPNVDPVGSTLGQRGPNVPCYMGWSSDAICRSPLAQVLVCCLKAARHYLNQYWLTCTTVVFCGIQLRAISQEVLVNLIGNMCSKIIILWLPPNLYWINLY